MPLGRPDADSGCEAFDLWGSELVVPMRPRATEPTGEGRGGQHEPADDDGERGPVSGAPVPGQAWLMPALATIGFAVNFWAWALLSPLGPRFEDFLDLSSFHQSLLVAVPVVAGSLGRIPVGAPTDRFGGREREAVEAVRARVGTLLPAGATD